MNITLLLYWNPKYYKITKSDSVQIASLRFFDPQPAHTLFRQGRISQTNEHNCLDRFCRSIKPTVC